MLTNCPIVNDARTAAFPVRTDTDANLANPAATFDELSETWILRQPGLKIPILLVIKQVRNLLCKGRCFDQLQFKVSATGVCLVKLMLGIDSSFKMCDYSFR